MATVTKKLPRSNQFDGAPYGNAAKHHFKLVTNAAGGATDADSAAALAIADIYRFGILPAGFKIVDALSIVSDAFTASVTAKLGFAYVDGVDSTDVPQDDDYFHAALAINAVGRTRANNTAVAPVTLPKEAYLIATIAGANSASVGVWDVIVEGINTGAP